MATIAMQMPDASQGPPYAPTTAGLGGIPTVHTDIPITAVFLFLFILGAISHMTILQLNRRKGHKFIMSGLMFGFCMARTTTCVLRIAWATRPYNIRLAIAAQIFVSAGVVLLLVINLIFTQRFVRAGHPNLGWHKSFSLAFKIVYAVVVISLVMLIACTVQSFYTLNANTRRIDRDVQLYGQVYFAVIAFAPIPLVIGGLIIPRKTRLDKFGSGRFRTKVCILLASAFLLSLGASFRAGTNIKHPRPTSLPAWYHSKACFYIFNFVVESLVIFMYIVLRVDRRFHIPDGSRGAGSYSLRTKQEEIDLDSSSSGGVHRVFSEEETFDDARQAQSMPKRREEETSVERLT